MSHTWKVSELDNGKRLDVFLTEQLPDMSRSQIAKRLKNGGGMVNGEEASVHRFIKTDDAVEFVPESKATVAKKTLPPPPITIVKDTKDWVVVDKAAGVVVHPDVNHPSGTLVDALLERYPEMAKVGEDPSRPGIMHRLDKEVSGLMVIAKTQAAFDGLKRQFAEHSVDKKYVALVYGEIADEEGEIKFRIARSTSKGRMAARPEKEESGKAAWTHYKRLKSYRHASLLELQIFSGRTHQIRAHLFAFSHPVIGDPLYTRKALERNITAPRLMLQSVHLEFKDPTTGEPQTFDLPLVPEFEQTIKLLGNENTP